MPLTEAGYDVVLVDPVPLHVDQARQSGVSSAVVGDARSLEFDDDSFDVVLLLGPLYHLTEREERVCALREAARVVRPSGVIVVAVISRFASTFDAWLDDDERRAILLRAIGRVESEPSLLGSSSHMLVVARPSARQQ